MIQQIQPFLRAVKKFPVEFQLRQIIRHRPVVVVEQAVYIQKLLFKLLQGRIISRYGPHLLKRPSHAAAHTVFLVSAQRVSQPDRILDLLSVDKFPVKLLYFLIFPGNKGRLFNLLAFKFRQRRLSLPRLFVHLAVLQLVHGTAIPAVEFPQFFLMRQKRFPRVGIQYLQLLCRL